MPSHGRGRASTAMAGRCWWRRVFLALVMAGAWGTQRRRGNAGVSDAFWSAGVGIAGLAVALVPAGADGEWTGRQVLVALLVAAWGTR